MPLDDSAAIRLPKMRIDIWSDVACPWCYVGKRNLDAALDQLGLEVEVHWRAFELDPNAPASTNRTMDEVLSAKYGMSPDEAKAANSHMTKVAAEAGLEYHLDRVRLTNSFDAHRLAELAGARGLGPEATERLFAAYFTEGELISDIETLVRLGREIGLPEEEVREVLGSDAFSQEVRQDEAAARDAGFTGVPTIVVDGRFTIPGAQPTDVMVRILGRLAEDDVPAP